jgi:hypothetical protein
LLLLREPSGLPPALKDYGSIKAPLIFEARSTGTPTAANAVGGLTSAVGAQVMMSLPALQANATSFADVVPLDSSSTKIPSPTVNDKYLDPEIVSPHSIIIH